MKADQPIPIQQPVLQASYVNTATKNDLSDEDKRMLDDIADTIINNIFRE